jgi:hypothetical protein
MERFNALLHELGAELGTSLHADKRGACKFKVNDQQIVQLEGDAAQENLIALLFIGEIPPGKYRENILKDALKSNGPFPIDCTLAYSERNNQLALFASLPLLDINGKVLADCLILWIAKANQWRTGIETGHTAQLVPSQPKTSGRLFG